MSSTSTGLSKSEKKRPRLSLHTPPLLIQLKEACRLLAVSYANIQRPEKIGRLMPHKLFPGPNGKVYYRLDELMALAPPKAAE